VVVLFQMILVGLVLIRWVLVVMIFELELVLVLIRLVPVLVVPF